MDSSIHHNGHNIVRHTSEEKLLNRIDRTAQALTSKIESIYERFGEIEDRVTSWVEAVEENPLRTIAVSFFAGLCVGAYLSRRD